MPILRSDLRNTSLIESPVNAVVDLYEQYVHDLGDKERQRKILQTGCLILINIP